MRERHNPSAFACNSTMIPPPLFFSTVHTSGRNHPNGFLDSRARRGTCLKQHQISISYDHLDGLLPERSNRLPKGNKTYQWYEGQVKDNSACVL